MLELTIEVTGEVRAGAQIQYDVNQCGIRGTRDYNYWIQLTCPATARDERGFVVDAQEIHNSVAEMFQTREILPSCEDLACEIAQMVGNLCPSFSEVVAKIGTDQVAYMTARLRAMSAAA